MAFTNADAYGQFMGRYSEPLAALFAAERPLSEGSTALDVGCGTGALTAVLCETLGMQNVAAVDPSPPFVEATRARLPGLDARLASAEDLPFDSARFDAVYAQLVVHFMPDPVAGIAEMARVTKPGGTVAACVWDHGRGGRGALAEFYLSLAEVDPAASDESTLPGVAEGHLPNLFEQAGLHDIAAGSLTVRVAYSSFEEWWHPFTLGVGPAGATVARLGSGRVAELRESCRRRFPTGAFEVSAVAWSVFGTAAALGTAA